LARSIATCVGIACAPLFLAGGGLGYSEIVEIDLGSGRVRRSVCAWSLPLHGVSRQTEFQRLIREVGVDRGAEDWRVTRSRTLFNSVSPHYRYHGVPSALETASRIIRESSLSHEDRRRSAIALLRSLQRDPPNDIVRVAQAETAAALASSDEGSQQ
jgi:hypothetical protein